MSESGRKFPVLYFSFQLLVLLSLVLIGTEVLVREIAHISAPGGAGTSFSTPHSELGWVNQSLTKGEMLYGVAERRRIVPVEVNFAGYRGAERAETEGQPLQQVALVGGSTVFGLGVHEREVFSAQLADLNGKINVQNFGVLGHSVDQSILHFEREVVATKPRVVVLLVKKRGPDSVYGDFVRPEFQVNSKRLLLVKRGTRWVGPDGRIALLKNFLLKHLVIFRHLTSILAKEGSKEQLHQEVASVVADVLIKRFLGKCEQHEIKAILLLVPTTVSAIEPSRFQVRLANECRSSVICDAVNLYPVFREAALHQSSLFIEDGIQLSDIGHALIARELQQRLEASLQPS